MNIFDFIIKSDNSMAKTMVDLTRNAFEKGLNPGDPEFFESIAVKGIGDAIDGIKTQICDLVKDAFENNTSSKKKTTTGLDIEEKQDYTYRF